MKNLFFALLFLVGIFSANANSYEVYDLNSTGNERIEYIDNADVCIESITTIVTTHTFPDGSVVTSTTTIIVTVCFDVAQK